MIAYGAQVTWIAYLDESMRQRRDGSGLYVLAAAVLDAEDAPQVREEIGQLVTSGAGKRLHWREESAARRRRAVTMLTRLDVLHLVVVGIGLTSSRQERGRRLCLRRLLWELGESGVEQVWIESRTPSLNAADTAAVAAMRARREISHKLRISFTYPSGEPLVWIPDIVAGAVGAAQADGDEQYERLLAPLLAVHMIELR